MDRWNRQIFTILGTTHIFAPAKLNINYILLRSEFVLESIMKVHSINGRLLLVGKYTFISSLQCHHLPVRDGSHILSLSDPAEQFITNHLPIVRHAYDWSSFIGAESILFIIKQSVPIFNLFSGS